MKRLTEGMSEGMKMACIALSPAFWLLLITRMICYPFAWLYFAITNAPKP